MVEPTWLSYSYLEDRAGAWHVSCGDTRGAEVRVAVVHGLTQRKDLNGKLVGFHGGSRVLPPDGEGREVVHLIDWWVVSDALARLPDNAIFEVGDGTFLEEVIEGCQGVPPIRVKTGNLRAFHLGKWLNDCHITCSAYLPILGKQSREAEMKGDTHMANHFRRSVGYCLEHIEEGLAEGRDRELL